ncbi:MAG: Transcription antitermination protein NusB [Verrucomicrobiota bacterium]|jgi:N utilization substance protein B
MSKRRDGREAAVQYLYQRDIHGGDAPELLRDFWGVREANTGVREFAESLIRGFSEKAAEVDEVLKRHIRNFEVARLNTVDRNILRLAIFEMFHRLETPPIVAINEAIELGKKFGGEDSGKFINGVLDQVKTELTRPLRDAVTPYTKGPKPQKKPANPQI